MENLTNQGETEPVDMVYTPQQEDTTMPNRRQYRGNEGLAWLAGVLDGEGYIGACQTSGAPIKADLAINNCSLPMLETARYIVHRVTGRRYSIHQCSDKKGRNFVFYSFRVSDQHGIWLLLRAIKPWLAAKRKQAYAMIEFCESRKLNRHKREGYTAYEQGIVARLQALKKAHYTPHPRAVETKREAPHA